MMNAPVRPGTRGVASARPTPAFDHVITPRGRYLLPGPQSVGPRVVASRSALDNYQPMTTCSKRRHRAESVRASSPPSSEILSENPGDDRRHRRGTDEGRLGREHVAGGAVAQRAAWTCMPSVTYHSQLREAVLLPSRTRGASGAPLESVRPRRTLASSSSAPCVDARYGAKTRVSALFARARTSGA